MLEHILDRLREAGFTEGLLVTGFRAELIESHFAGYPMPLRTVRQTTLDGTGAATLLAREFCGDEPFLLTFGDILTGAAEYAAMRDGFDAHPETAALLAAKHVDDPWQGAAIYETGGVVSKIVEKPPRGSSTTQWNSAGVYIFRPVVFEILAGIPRSPRGEYELTTAIERMLEGGQCVRLHALTGGWRDVGRPEDLDSAREMV